MKKHDLFIRNTQIVSYHQLHPELTMREIGKEFNLSPYRTADIISDFKRNYTSNIFKYVCLKIQEPIYETGEITRLAGLNT